MSDQNFHEIQLSGKQLVFLFMCAVVLTVVVFLFGVAVGREVRSGAAQTTQVTTPAGTGDPAAASAPVPAASASGAPADPAANELSYAQALEGREGDDPSKAAPPPPAAEHPPAASSQAMKSAEPKAPATAPKGPAAEMKAPPAEMKAPPTVQTKAPPAAETKAAAESKAPVETKASAEPAKAITPPASPRIPAPPPVPAKDAPKPSTASAGWVVQVGAFNANDVATREVSKLQGKGYPAFVFTEPATSQGPRFKVRVGPYSARAEADQMLKSLTSEGYRPFLQR